jgi:hypothetical protein
MKALSNNSIFLWHVDYFNELYKFYVSEETMTIKNNLHQWDQRGHPQNTCGWSCLQPQDRGYTHSEPSGPSAWHHCTCSCAKKYGYTYHFGYLSLLILMTQIMREQNIRVMQTPCHTAKTPVAIACVKQITNRRHTILPHSFPTPCFKREHYII